MNAASACLYGIKCRYDGNSCLNVDIAIQKDLILVCPEVLGGLTTPRLSCEIVGKITTNSYDDLVAKRIRVLNNKGEDISKAFIKGANKALDILIENNVKKIYLKSKSPSCGTTLIYDGTFNSKLVNGSGIFASLLKKHNIKIIEV